VPLPAVGRYADAVSFLRRRPGSGDDGEPIASPDDLVSIPNRQPNPGPRYGSIPSREPSDTRDRPAVDNVTADASAENVSRVRRAIGDAHGTAADGLVLHLSHTDHGDMTIYVDHRAAIITKDIRPAGNHDIVRIPLVNEQVGGAAQYAIHSDASKATLIAQARVPLPTEPDDDDLAVLLRDALDQVYMVWNTQPPPGFQGTWPD
jgi:hypothetical protein